MIEKLNEHYSFTTPASIHDEEALTALELAGRQGKKINEIITDQNALRKETEETIVEIQEDLIPREVKSEVKEQIENGTFDDQISESLGDLNERVNTLLGSLTEGSTTGDAELIDLRTDFTGTGETHKNARLSLRQALGYSPFPQGAIYEGDVDLNHWKYTDPKIYSFAGAVQFTNAPEVMKIGSGGDVVWYLKTEATDRYQVNERGFYPRGIQTVFNLRRDKVYVRFFNVMDPDFGTVYSFTDWKPADVSGTFRTITDASTDLDKIVEVDQYIIATDNCLNSPINAGGLLKVSKVSHGWIVQDLYGLHNNPCHFFRIGNCPTQTETNGAEDISITWSEWKQSRTTDMHDHEDITKSEVDINQIVEPKTYIIAVTNSQNKPPIENGYLLEVVSYNKGWLVQYAHPIWPACEMYFRTGKNNNNAIAENFADGLDVEWSDWSKVASTDYVDEKIKAIPSGGGSGSSAPKSNEGQTIVFIGDSIIGACRDNTSVTSHVANMTGATVYNCCIGGTRLICRDEDEDTDWGRLDIDRILVAIRNGDFTEQVNAAARLEEGGESNILAPVETLVGIDWSTVDILVISGGTNDWSSGVNLPDRLDDTYGMNDIFMEQFTQEFPNMKIVYVTPPPRADGRWEWGEFWDDSLPQNTNNNRDVESFEGEENVSLKEWCVAIEGVANKWNFPCVNLHKVGVNIWNIERWLDDPETDPVHPNALGRKEIAKAISQTLAKM